MGNGNGHNDGYHCYRCGTGILLREWNDIYCLMCGWRLSFSQSYEPEADYFAERVAACLQTDSIVLIEQISNKSMHLAGMAR